MNHRHRSALATRLGGSLLGLAVISGCQSGYREHAVSITDAFDAGRYAAAADRAQVGARIHAGDPRERVIYHLEAARTAQVAGDFSSSIGHYDQAYRDVRPYLDSRASYSISEGIVTTTVNQTMANYKATPGERVMINALNATNHLAIGDADSARIELNRAADWQEDAVDRYRAELEADHRAIEHAARAQSVDEVTTRRIPDHLRSHYRNIDDLRGDADLRNPFVNHLRGIVLLTSSDPDDRDQARFELRQAVAINPATRRSIEPDLAWLDGAGDSRVPPTTWIYVLTGKAPHLEQIAVTVPIFVDEVPTVAAAFPVLRTNPDYLSHFTARTSSGRDERSVEIVDFDEVVGTEFRARLPVIISREMVSAAGKAAATYGLSEQFGDWGTILGTAYQIGSAQADVRSWRTLPKEIELIRIPTPGDGRIRLEGPAGRPLANIAVEPGTSTIVLVTLPSSRSASPSVTTLPLPPGP